MIDYLKMLQLRKQGASINAIANAMSCKWDTVEQVISRCLNAWGNLESIPDVIMSRKSLPEFISKSLPRGL